MAKRLQFCLDFFPSKAKKIITGICWIALCIAGMAVFFGPTDNWSWDPSYYYAQVRSPIIENNLNFRDETRTNGIVTAITPTGLQGSPWPVGPSILWSPFFILAHFLVLLIAPAQATGYSFSYIVLVSFGSVLYGALGVVIIYQTCQHFSNKFVSALAGLLCVGATPLFFYTFHQPIMAHTTSLLVSAALISYYIRLVDNRWLQDRSGLIFGVLLGLNFLTRWSALLFAVLPIIYYANELVAAARAKNSVELRLVLQQICIAIAAFGLTISPQLVLWQRLYGRFLIFPQGSNSFVAGILPLNIFNLFFDTNRGLLFWSPFVLVGLLGILRIPNRLLRFSMLGCVLLQIVLIGYRVDWYGGGGYGPRYFIELLPIVAVGFVCLVQGISTKPAGTLILALFTIGLLAHQAVLLYAIEHASDGWANLADYLKGRSLGVEWQLDAMLRLVKNPALWLAPRTDIAQGRQTILVNYAAKVRNFDIYAIPGTAVALTPVAVVAALITRRNLSRLRLPIVLSGVVTYFVAWALYFVFVG